MPLAKTGDRQIRPKKLTRQDVSSLIITATCIPTGENCVTRPGESPAFDGKALRYPAAM